MHCARSTLSLNVLRLALGTGGRVMLPVRSQIKLQIVAVHTKSYINESANYICLHHNLLSNQISLEAHNHLIFASVAMRHNASISKAWSQRSD